MTDVPKVLLADDDPAIRPLMTAQGANHTEAVADGNVVHAVIQKPFDLNELTTLLVDTATAMHAERTRKAATNE